MSRVNKMSLKEILKEVRLILRENDIVHFCYNIEVVEKYVRKYREVQGKMSEIEKFLVENEKDIDKENLILLTILNYIENINLIEERVELVKRQLDNNNSEKAINELAKYRIQLHEQNPNLEKAKKLAKGIEQVLTYYYYDVEKGKYNIDVVDSKELIDGKKINRTKALKRFDEIDSSFKAEKEDELGMEYILQSILLTDLAKIFCNEKFGNYVRTLVLENEILKKGIKKEKIEKLRAPQYDEEYTKLIEEVDFADLLPQLKETLRRYVEYIDIDKMLLISAYRFEEGLEETYLENCLSVKEILEVILENIKDQSLNIHCKLERYEEDKYVTQEVIYSVKYIKECLSKFTDKTYLTKKQRENYKNKINNNEISLIDIEEDHIDIIFSQADLEKLSTQSVDNFMYVYQKYNWDVSKIIGLYETNSIPLEYINAIKDQVDFSNLINVEELMLNYKQFKDLEDEQVVNRYKNYLNLYKEIYLIDKEEKNIENNLNMIMEKIVENFEGEEYRKAIKQFYIEGIISLNAIAEWGNENLIIELFNQGLTDLTAIKQLARKGKLPTEYLNKVYINLINDNNIEYDERLRLIKEGFVLEKDIFDLYRRNLIFEKDLTQLANDGIVRNDEARRVINSRTMKELERNSAIRLTGVNSLTKKNSDIYSYGYGSIGTEASTRKTGKFIIDPNERERFIRTLNAYKANTDLASDSPFFNYEFYVIPDETGTIGLNSVVIAERYYEDKDTETKFATNNATYFFKYKDLMVLGNLRKSEMTKERENIVFTANHVIANDKREGRWATSVISCIAKTMLSSDLKEYTKANRRKIIQQKLSEIYTTQQLIDILTMVSDIDLGEYICEIEEPLDYNKRKINKNAGCISAGESR